jgi:hypothetical protein
MSMDHSRFKANQSAALYVNGSLDAFTQEAFELHLMGCRSCVEEVELWRAMRSGLQSKAGADALTRSHGAAQRTTGWQLAASLAFVAVGSAAAGYYASFLRGASLADETTAVFNLPPLTRGFDDCEPLPLASATELIALRVPNATAGWHLELTDEDGVAIAEREYAVRTQADGSWLLRLHARPFAGELLRLQTRAEGGIAEPLGCFRISASR